jgi:hypothetical protein
MGEKKNAYMVFREIRKRKKPFGRPSCRRQDIKLHLKGRGLVEIDCIKLAQDMENG